MTTTAIPLGYVALCAEIKLMQSAQFVNTFLYIKSLHIVVHYILPAATCFGMLFLPQAY